MRIAAWLKAPLWMAALFLGGFVHTAQAQDHLVPLSDLRHDLTAAAAERTSNIAAIEDLLARPEGQRELAKARLNSAQVEKAISFMSDEDLARLGSRARSAEQDVRGGNLIVTLLAIIGAIVVIIVVVALVA